MRFGSDRSPSVAAVADGARRRPRPRATDEGNGDPVRRTGVCSSDGVTPQKWPPQRNSKLARELLRYWCRREPVGDTDGVGKSLFQIDHSSLEKQVRRSSAGGVERE
ncbi:hypothetical protein B1756_10815 [Natrarchaeobaculum aegyptiacum]|uniref:Uncharacterized protein n=1 Tax=Natrarchaeobaculum aegyptiacum TaxID=745377 RepID=A0A2Z2I198_9EURY|nr:hypothetical protein B1756_10815 [Natrarchaeobaculum aegyptiacum]